MNLENIICFYLFIVFNTLMADGINIRVKTSKGVVRGVVMESKGNNNTKMLVFKGIPYAKAPVGELRFKAPVPVSSWTGVKVLSEVDKPFCPQTGLYGFTGLMGYSEDCLFVNVYTPSTATVHSTLPVMVYIHGGGFVAGSGRYAGNGPDYLVDQNVIVVTLNYRLGALGFLSLGTEDAPGNAGLKDQNLALKWVQEEISHFGGDPNNVTILGESAGSASVHFHVLSNMSKGLFHRAIGESGVALSGWPFLNTGYKERAMLFAKAINCVFNNDINITCLQKCKVEDILDHQSISLSEEDRIPGNIFGFVPTLDVNVTENPFFTDRLENLIKDPPNKVPMIMGVNDAEGILFVPTDAEFYTTLPNKLYYFITKSTRDQINNYTVSEKVKQIEMFYFNNTKPSLQNVKCYINLITDKMFAVDTALTAKALAKHSNVFLYHFDYDGNFRIPTSRRNQLNVTGAAHADEIPYLFVLSQVNQTGYSSDSSEMKTLHTMVRMWTNFAKFGTPILETADTYLQNAKWYPISENSTKYLRIRENISMSTDDFHENSVALWLNIETPVNSPTPITPPVPTTPHSTSPTTPSSASTIPPTTESTILPTTESTIPPTTESTLSPPTTSTKPPTTESTIPPTTESTIPPTTTSTKPPTTIPTTTGSTTTTISPITTTTIPTIPPGPEPSKSVYMKFNALTLILTISIFYLC